MSCCVFLMSSVAAMHPASRQVTRHHSDVQMMLQCRAVELSYMIGSTAGRSAADLPGVRVDSALMEHGRPFYTMQKFNN